MGVAKVESGCNLAAHVHNVLEPEGKVGVVDEGEEIARLHPLKKDKCSIGWNSKNVQH